MALTEFQRNICRIIAQSRLDSGESYVAGASALNSYTGLHRVSRDIDLFHDSIEAVQDSWNRDRDLLSKRGYAIDTTIERAGYVEAVIAQSEDHVVMQWTADSAFRFFPLVSHEDFGLTLHPFDLATNKVLALVGRLEVRDWVDVMACYDRIQKLGYLAWAAPGKDPGVGPAMIIEQAGRSARYSADEVASLEFEGKAPDAVIMSQRWKAMLQEAQMLIELLPPDEVGTCLLDVEGALYQGGLDALHRALANGHLRFHRGCMRGAYPSFAK